MKDLLSILSFSVLTGFRALGGQTPALPSLRIAFTTSSVDLAPVNRLTPLAVGPQGNVLFVSSASITEPRMSFVDSTGKLITRLGRNGSGPGEVRTPRPVEVSKDRASVWDTGNNAFLEWDLRGAVLQSLKPAGSSIVSIVGKELVGLKNVAGGWRMVALDRGSGQEHELIPATDTFMTAHFGPVNGKARSPFAPIPGLWEDGFVVADAAKYALALYRWDGALVRVLGRDLPPMHASAGRIDEFLETMGKQAAARGQPSMDAATMAQVRKQGLDQVLPQITPGGPIRIDSHNRIWVLGMEGDSAFADVFTRDRFIGRLHLPCRLYNGFWGLSGTWLVLGCLPDNPKFDGDAIVKLFRIVEGTR